MQCFSLLLYARMKLFSHLLQYENELYINPFTPNMNILENVPQFGLQIFFKGATSQFFELFLPLTKMIITFKLKET